MLVLLRRLWRRRGRRMFVLSERDRRTHDDRAREHDPINGFRHLTLLRLIVGRWAACGRGDIRRRRSRLDTQRGYTSSRDERRCASGRSRQLEGLDVGDQQHAGDGRQRNKRRPDVEREGAWDKRRWFVRARGQAVDDSLPVSLFCFMTSGRSGLDCCLRYRSVSAAGHADHQRGRKAGHAQHHRQHNRSDEELHRSQSN